jgi:hypothetical protein
MKVVINNCHGGFGLSEKAMRRYAELKGITLYAEKGEYGMINYFTVPKDKRTPALADWHSASLKARQAANAAHKAEGLYDRDIERNDPALVQTVEDLGKEASDKYADLKVVEIPDDADWEIDEYDGSEWVSEKHRRWS